jgi:hypothetical protein
MSSDRHANFRLHLPDPLLLDHLPVECSLAEHRIDGLIGDLAFADKAAAPVDLADRIFQASVSQLPASGEVVTMALAGRTEHWGEARTAATMQRWSLRNLAWSRIAMAASVGLAFCVCLVVLRSPAHRASGPVLAAGHSNDNMLARADAASARASLLTSRMADLNAPGTDSIDDVNRRMGYLLETDDLNSLDDVRGELNQLIAALNM